MSEPKDKSHSPKPRIVQYQRGDRAYTYSKFWDGRQYDQKAENLLLRRYLRRYFSNLPKTAWLSDIGGNYGRLIPVYAPYFGNVAILDYAVNEFHVAQKTAALAGVKLHLVRANAYRIPLLTASQKHLISVRVIHHLENPELFFEEINRILRPGGLFIFQTANKNNLKLWLQSCLTGNWQAWRDDYVDIGHSGVDDQGSFDLIRNYSDRYIESLIDKTGLKILHKRSISWLRSLRWARKCLWLSYPLEFCLQTISVLFPRGPSNWYVLEKPQAKGLVDKEHHHFLQTLYSTKDRQRIVARKRILYRKKTKRGTPYFDLLDVS